MNDAFSYLSIALLLALSAFFSATEIAFASVNQVRLKSIQKQKKSLAVSLALKISENYDETLGAILVGNNLANTASSSIATLIVIGALGENYAWVATAVMTLLVLTFGEIIPKVVASRTPSCSQKRCRCLFTVFRLY